MDRRSLRANVSYFVIFISFSKMPRTKQTFRAAWKAARPPPPEPDLLPPPPKISPEEQLDDFFYDIMKTDLKRMARRKQEAKTAEELKTCEEEIARIRQEMAPLEQKYPHWVKS